jgi:hypothetical protein
MRLGVRAPAVTSVGPAVTLSSHLPHRPPKPRTAHGFPLLSPLPAAKGVDTRRPSPLRDPVQRMSGGEGQQHYRLVTSPPPSSTRVAPPPELGPPAPMRSSRLAAMRRHAPSPRMLRPALAHSSTSDLILPRESWTLLQVAPPEKKLPERLREISLVPSSAIAPPPWSPLA